MKDGGYGLRVIGDLRVSVGEALLELALGLDTSIFHIFEVLCHVLHLVFEKVQVLIFSFLSLDHFYGFLYSKMVHYCK
jgi:hypothetical protein